MEKMSSLLSHMIALTLEASKLKNDEELLHEANIMIDELNQLSYALDIRSAIILQLYLIKGIHIACSCV